MKNVTLLLALSSLLISCNNKFPDYLERANNKVIVSALEGSHIISIDSRAEREIEIHDSIDICNLLFLREGKGVTCTKGRIPHSLKGKKKYKLKFFVFNTSGLGDISRDTMQEIIKLSNKFLDKLLLGIEISLVNDNWVKTINYSPTYVTSPCQIRNYLESKKTIALLVSNPQRSDTKAIAKRCTKGLVIVSSGAILNPVTFTHEIMHLFTDDDLDPEHNSKDVMKKTVPISDKIYSYNSHIFKLEKLQNVQTSFRKQHHSEIYFNNPISSMIPSSGGNNVEYNRWAKYLILDNNWNEEILFTMHPEDVTKRTKGFNQKISTFLVDFSNDSLPSGLIARMEDIFNSQHEILSRQNFQKREERKWYDTIIDFFYPPPPPIKISKQDYVRISFKNLKYIRDRNMLYWIARKEKFGINVDLAIQAISERNLYSRYLEIKNVIE